MSWSLTLNARSFGRGPSSACRLAQERYVTTLRSNLSVQSPVAGLTSCIGSVFEKRLIEAYIAENGKDPVNGDELSTEDLIDIKTSRVVRPRPPTLTSIPSLLNVFQEEWDALALEAYTLRQTLSQTRQELSTALYQHDAAVRVVARLTKERDEARDALSKVTVGASRTAGAGDEAMQVDSTGIPEAVLARIESTQASYVDLIRNYV